MKNRGVDDGRQSFGVDSTSRRSNCIIALITVCCCGINVAWGIDSSTNLLASMKKYHHHRSPLTASTRIPSYNSRTSLYQKHKYLAFLPRGGDSAILTGTIPSVVEEVVDLSHLIDDAYSWCCSLGAPSALVAAAVVAAIYENMHSGDLEIDKSDGKWVQLGKKLTRLLLLSAFALETLSIFVTTVTGTMLLSRKHDQMLIEKTDVTTPLEFLKENFEFEYLTASITFLQGLMHWLAAIALGHVLPSPGDEPDTPTEIALSKFIAWSMGAVILLMISFYNNHITLYSNYGSMLARWFYVMIHGHVFGIGTFPPRPLSILLLITVSTSLYYGYISLSRSEHSSNTKRP